VPTYPSPPLPRTKGRVRVQDILAWCPPILVLPFPGPRVEPAGCPLPTYPSPPLPRTKGRVRVQNILAWCPPILAIYTVMMPNYFSPLLITYVSYRIITFRSSCVIFLAFFAGYFRVMAHIHTYFYFCHFNFVVKLTMFDEFLSCLYSSLSLNS
jgi:hypothetical protein